MLFNLQQGQLGRRSVTSGGGATDPNFSSVSLLLHCEGTDGSTTFTDSSSNAHTITASGNAQIDTADYKFGSASGLYDGTGDYLATPTHASFDLGTGDWTIEGWFKNHDNNGATRDFFTFYSGASAVVEFYAFYNGSTTEIAFYEAAGGTIVNPAGSNLAAIWRHYAWVRDGTTLRIFENGSQLGTGSVSGVTMPSGVTFGVGRPFHTLPARAWQGWIDEVRVTKGVARYTSSFTAPSAPFPDA